MKIEFYDKNDNPITVPEDCYEKIVAYKDPNCSDNNEITATVSLTEKGAQVYDLGTHELPHLLCPQRSRGQLLITD